MPCESATYVFQCPNALAASTVNSGLLLVAEVNQDFSEAYSAINSINSDNISSGFTFDASAICASDTPVFYTAIQAEDVINEIGHYWFNVAHIGFTATSIHNALNDLGSAVSALLLSSATGNRSFRYQKPVLEWVNSQTIKLEYNGSNSTSFLLFPDGIIREQSASNNLYFKISNSGFFSNDNGCAIAGMIGGTASNDTWVAIYGAAIGSANMFTLIGNYNLPNQTSVLTVESTFGGTSNWVYLGLIRYGDNRPFIETANSLTRNPSGIMPFIQMRNETRFINIHSNNATAVIPVGNLLMAWAQANTNLGPLALDTFGINTTEIPRAFGEAYFQANIRGYLTAAWEFYVLEGATIRHGIYAEQRGTATNIVVEMTVPIRASANLNTRKVGAAGTTGTQAIVLMGFIDELR